MPLRPGDMAGRLQGDAAIAAGMRPATAPSLSPARTAAERPRSGSWRHSASPHGGQGGGFAPRVRPVTEAARRVAEARKAASASSRTRLSLGGAKPASEVQ